MVDLARSDVTLVGAAVIIIVFAIVLTATVQGSYDKSFSQIITVGPVWTSNSWICTSNENFIVHGVLISYDDPSRLIISISGVGTQPDFELFPFEMHSFSIGATADSSMTITRDGNISGLLTLQTPQSATAECVEI